MKRRTFLLTTIAVSLTTVVAGGLKFVAPVVGNELQHQAIDVPDDATDVIVQGEILGETNPVYVFVGLDDNNMHNNLLLNVVHTLGKPAYWQNSLMGVYGCLPLNFKIYYERDDQKYAPVMNATLQAHAVVMVENNKRGLIMKRRTFVQAMRLGNGSY